MRESHPGRAGMSGRRPSPPLSGFASRFRPSVWRAAAVLALVVLASVPGGQARAQTAVLVSNIGQTTAASTSNPGFNYAQPFKTGSNADGYTLESVEIEFNAARTDATGLTVQLATVTTTPTITVVATMTNPSSIGVGANTFTAPSATKLTAGTDYAVLVTGTAQNMRRTASFNEDSGAAAGWHIWDGVYYRSTGGWNGSTNVLKIRVNGTVIGSTAPRNSAPRKQAASNILAAVASRTVAGALDNIGTRMGDAAPGLTLAGEPVQFREAAGRRDWPDGMACPPDARGRAFETGAPGCAPHARSRGADADALMRGSSFSWTLGAAPGDKADDKGIDPDAPRWAVWGRGDFGSFAGRTGDRSGRGSRHDGDLRTGWLGADARGTRGPGRWVAGLAVSRGTSRTDYVLGGDKGRIETDLTALWPYGRWTFPDGMEMRGLLGVGRGEARHRAGDGEEEKSDLSMWAASAGFSRPLPPIGGVDLSARGDASLAFMETATGQGEEEQAVDGLRVGVSRVRGGVEASKRIAMADGAALMPFAELAGRMDGGDGVTGPGVELAGGLRYAASRVAVEVRGRWLAAHTEAGAKERGVSLTARLDPEALGRGLSMSLSPRWGAGTDGADALWREELPRGTASGVTNARDAGALEGELGYGFGHFGGRLIGTPNLGFGASDGGGRDYRVGWRLTPAGGDGFRVDLDATRRESAGTGEPAHGAMLTGAIRW